MIYLYTGSVGSGKTLKLAEETLYLINKNVALFKKTGKLRLVSSRIRFAPAFEKKYKNFFEYWNSALELVGKRDCDIIWDEISVDLDATQWANTPLEMKRWLQQHRKRGIDIYGTTQDFGTVDKSLRRLVRELWVLEKLVGSRDISPTKPPVKHPWGLIRLREVDKKDYTKEREEYTFIRSEYMFIKKELTSMYDTTQEIYQGEYPPLFHSERKCETCGFIKTIHS